MACRAFFRRKPNCQKYAASESSSKIKPFIIFLQLSLISFLLVPCSSSAVPHPPTGLTASDVTASTVTLRWDPDTSSSDPVRSYVVQYQLRGSVQRTREETGITKTAYMVSNLKPYSTYIFQVIAVNSAGRSRPSQPVNATTEELG